MRDTEHTKKHTVRSALKQIRSDILYGSVLLLSLNYLNRLKNRTAQHSDYGC
jgi:hypothetical protein